MDPFAIAEEKKIAVEERDGFPRDVFGALLLERGRFRIFISTRCFGDGHRRFTVAHELGHYHVDGHLDELLATGEGLKTSAGGHFRGRDPEEREADWFAAELLVPTPWASMLIAGSEPSFNLISRIATEFGVSAACAGVRLADVCPDPVAVVLALGNQIEWVAMSERFREHPWARRSWKAESVPARSATAALGRSHSAVRVGCQSQGASLLCEWFEGAPAAVEAFEEVMGLGDYGRTLTLLLAPELPDPEEVEESEQERSESGTGDWRDGIRPYRLG